MAAKKTANVWVNLYDGDFDIGFDCVGVESCRFAFCSLMPPDGSEECVHNRGECRSVDAQISTIKNLRNRITKKMKELAEETE